MLEKQTIVSVKTDMETLLTKGKPMQRPEVTENEIIFDGGYMITETDLSGCITYANRKFLEITGYTLKELIGTPHNIIRHPKMPRATFREMWEVLCQGSDWNGYVINLTKNGSYYWVDVYITPRCDERGNIVGYIAARKIPSQLTLEKIKAKYERMLRYEAAPTSGQLLDSAARVLPV